MQRSVDGAFGEVTIPACPEILTAERTHLPPTARSVVLESGFFELKDWWALMASGSAAIRSKGPLRAVVR